MTGRTREQDAFLAGLMASGEGWNGEYPYEGDTPEDVWPDIAESYDKWALEQVPVQVRTVVASHYDGTTVGYIRAIKELRGLTGWGLKEAKDAIDVERQRRGLTHD